MKKKVLAIVAVCVLAAATVACGSKKEEAAAPATEQEAAAPEELVEADTAESVETKEETVVEQSITGTVVDATMNVVTIESEDGETFEFMLEGADVSGLEDGILLDNKITVKFEGDAKAEDISTIKVISISDAK